MGSTRAGSNKLSKKEVNKIDIVKTWYVEYCKLCESMSPRRFSGYLTRHYPMA